MTIPNRKFPGKYDKYSPVDEPFVELETGGRIIVDLQYPKAGFVNAVDVCLLRKTAFEKLIKASELLPKGYRFLIFDVWRPFALQTELFEVYSNSILEKSGRTFADEAEKSRYISRFVSMPKKEKGVLPVHTTGGAVDLTIVDELGNLLDMGTEFDSFESQANTAYFENAATPEAMKIRDNRRLLYEIMMAVGFTHLPSDWWHFDYGDRFWAYYNDRPAIYEGAFTTADVKIAEKDYWHEHHHMPQRVKQELKALAEGETVTVLHPVNHEPVSLLKVSGETFGRAFALNRTYLFRGDYTAPAEEHDYSSDECYLTEDGLAGFCITENNWLVSMFSNEGWRGFLFAVSPLLAGVSKLVCVASEKDNGPVNAYKKVLGFEEIACTVNDREIMAEYYGQNFMENFVCNYGNPHHIFLCRADGSEKPEIKAFEDYFEAEAYVDKLVR